MQQICLRILAMLEARPTTHICLAGKQELMEPLRTAERVQLLQKLHERLRPELARAVTQETTPIRGKISSSTGRLMKACPEPLIAHDCGTRGLQLVSAYS